MSVENTDVFTFNDIIVPLQNAQDGDILNFNIKNDITFTSAAPINRSITINLINSSAFGSVTLLIANGGTYRHFTTGTGVINNVSMTVGASIILDGSGTGGGIQLIGSNDQLTLDECTVTNCRSSGNGGGILIQGNVSRSSLIMNNALIENCTAGAGAGIFALAGSITMNGGGIINNRANNTGGGIQTIGGANSLGCTITVTDGRISNNSTGSFGNGGGIGAHDTIVTITDSIISFNTADDFGGGIFSFNQSGNVALNSLIINSSTITGNTTRNTGGGIGVLNELSTFTIDSSFITENISNSTLAGTKQGGGIYFAGDSTLTIRDTEVSGNEAGTSGGGIFANLSTLIVTGATMICDNEAALTAGGIYGYQGCTILIEENARIINNRALSGGDPESTSRGGGGIALLAFGFVSTLTVTGNAQIRGNKSVSYGGGIWTYPTFGPETVVNITGATVEGNTANFGGGISMGAIPGFTPALTITNAVIADNTALTDGGGIIAMESLVSIIGSQIINNSAGRNGGGIFTDELVNVTVDSSSAFSGNTAQTYAYWSVTSGGDSDIHKTHIFTNQFSTFIPVQTPPPEVWAFTNAYNNYDINYVKPVKTVTVNYVDVNNPSHIIHQTTIDSFIGATVVIPPRETVIDADGVVWTLSPPGQPAQTVELTDPEADYVVTFTYTTGRGTVVVTEFYVDICDCQIMSPTKTIVEVGGTYTKTAPEIPGFTIVGFRINSGPLQFGTVTITDISEDTTVTFVYCKICTPPINCRCCRKKNPHWN